MSEQASEIVIYETSNGLGRVDVRLDGESVWLTQQQLATLFGSSRTNVVEHIKHIYEEGELLEEATCRNIRQVRQEGNRTYRVKIKSGRNTIRSAVWSRGSCRATVAI